MHLHLDLRSLQTVLPCLRCFCVGSGHLHPDPLHRTGVQHCSPLQIGLLRHLIRVQTGRVLHLLQVLPVPPETADLVLRDHLEIVDLELPMLPATAAPLHFEHPVQSILELQDCPVMPVLSSAEGLVRSDQGVADSPDLLGLQHSQTPAVGVVPLPQQLGPGSCDCSLLGGVLLWTQMLQPLPLALGCYSQKSVLHDPGPR